MKGGVWTVVLVGLIAGCGPKPTTQTLPPLPKVETPPPSEPVKPKEPIDLVPDYPKPPVEDPVPDEPMPSPMIGNINELPAAGTPMSPEMPMELPKADLKADEALIRRLVLEAGGDVVSADDVRDTGGVVGRSIIAEIAGSDGKALRSTLTKKLGAKVIITDAGSGTVVDASLKKDEEELAAVKKKRDQARIDFLPNAPILRQLEEDVMALEQSLAENRRRVARVRLGVLLRPVL